MQKYIYYGIGLGVAFIAGYILAAYYTKKVQDDAHDAAIDTVLRSSDAIADLKNKVSSLERDNEKLRDENVYLKQSDESEEVDEEEVIEKSEIIQRIADNNIIKAPYLITYNQFEDHDYDFFNKISLSYYPIDDILCNDEYEAVSQDETVGSENLDIFRINQDEVTVLYVRNEVLLSDYEIVLEEGSYREEVLGIEEDE